MLAWVVMKFFEYKLVHPVIYASITCWLIICLYFVSWSSSYIVYACAIPSSWNSAMVSSVPTQPFLSPFPILPSSASSFLTIEWVFQHFFVPFRSILIPPLFFLSPSLMVDQRMVRHSVEVCANFRGEHRTNSFSISLIFYSTSSISLLIPSLSQYILPPLRHTVTSLCLLRTSCGRRTTIRKRRRTAHNKDAAAPCDDYCDPADGTVARIID